MNVEVSSAIPEGAFERIVPMDLTTLFLGYGPLPAVVAVRDQTGAWDAVGQSRTVVLSDGGTAHEELTGYEAGRFFSYTVSGFTGPIRFLARRAFGQWDFSQDRVVWTYRWEPRHFLTYPLLWPVVKFLWRPYMRNALRLAVSYL